MKRHIIIVTLALSAAASWAQQTPAASPQTASGAQSAAMVDGEVRKVLLSGADKAEGLLKENLESLHKAAKILLERETLDGEELDVILRGEELPPISKQTINAMRSLKIGIEANESNEENKLNNN